ncbi:hypothetical protein CMEL01_15252 [Colletotrichum melonis]|uniref:Uncharacterized protein n=1 Tax=Colletotrichum melonis TaxID=1209925 RepID=A0AAI9UQG4_9PEZI|nr:hypothetical protein CMEL01_15252 [Colletotrichum melonis]
MTVEWRTCLEHCDQALPTKPMAPVPHREIICSFLSCLSVFCTERPTDRPTDSPGVEHAMRWNGMGREDMCSCTKCGSGIQSLLSRCRHVVTLG